MKEDKNKPIGKLKAAHIVGLPAAPGDSSLITFWEDQLEIAAGGKFTKLPYSSILGMSAKGKTNVHQEKVQSAGRAVAGGMLFGTVGAIAGSAPKTKTSLKYKRILTIEYSEGYLQFEITRKGKAKRLIGKVQSKFHSGN